MPTRLLSLHTYLLLAFAFVLVLGGCQNTPAPTDSDIESALNKHVQAESQGVLGVDGFALESIREAKLGGYIVTAVTNDVALISSNELATQASTGKINPALVAMLRHVMTNDTAIFNEGDIVNYNTAYNVRLSYSGNEWTAESL